MASEEKREAFLEKHISLVAGAVSLALSAILYPSIWFLLKALTGHELPGKPVFSVQDLVPASVWLLALWLAWFLFTRKLLQSRSDRREFETRFRALKRLEVGWINRFLEPSIEGREPMCLPLRFNPSRVKHPGVKEVRSIPEECTRDFPPGTSIDGVFDESGRSLLVLGEPGSGKTTLLLQLSKHLHSLAVKDRSKPIPVFLSLSNWNRWWGVLNSERAFERWIVRQMKKTYLIEKDLGREWLGTGKLVLLLDGLDEVTALGARHSCHNAIQELIKRRHCGLSVSSRTEEYLTLNPLQLNFAVEVLPAKESQVLQYIATIPSAHRLGLALKKDPNAITVLTTPFALTLALVAYSKKSKLQPSAGSFSIFRLLDDFVNTQISIKLKRNEYKREDFLRWMRNLAQCSKTGKQAVFDPLELRERWLATAWQHAACKLATILAVAAFCFLVEEALWTGYYTGIARCWNGPLTVPCWELALEQRDFSILKTFPGDFLWSAIQAGIAACVIGVPVGVFGPLFRLRPVQFAPTVLFPGRIRQALQAFIVAFAGISGVSTLMGLILRRLYQINILPERSNWASPLGQLKGPMHAAVGYAVGRTLTVTASALVGLFIASLLAFTAFLSFDTNSNRTLPSAIKTTISIALVLGVSTGTFLWLFVPSAVIQNMTRLGSDLIEKPDIPFGGALLVVLAAGGLFTIRFYITRLMMVVTRNGPWNYGRFLDLATECWFLCPVSGSDRIFRHPMLRNYFADPTMGGHPR